MNNFNTALMPSGLFNTVYVINYFKCPIIVNSLGIVIPTKGSHAVKVVV